LREVTLTIKRELSLPVTAGEICPDKFAGRSVEEIETIKVWEGNKQSAIEDVFRVTDKPDESEEITIKVVGNASKIRGIGSKTSSGSVIIEGNTGMYVGEGMSGGSILVTGNAGSWLGSRMKGGRIEVKGNAGDYVGSGYRGTDVGMKGGSIIIHGDAGNEVGCWMKKGTIRINGNTGLYPGMHMSNGTILTQGDCVGRAGAQMKGGKLILSGRIPTILPSFTFEEIQEKAKFADEKIVGPFYVFSGDMNENGKGKLSVRVSSNTHLKWCEQYLEA
jgi:formylmethanofuran dehydrogenase subunit C